MNVVERIRNGQNSIDALLSAGMVASSESREITNRWRMELIYQKTDCSIGFAQCDRTSAGLFPEHVHMGCKEYIICVTGSVLLNINGQNVRVLKPGDCATVPADVLHFSKPLEDNTKLAFICVPWDEHMTTLLGK